MARHLRHPNLEAHGIDFSLFLTIIEPVFFARTRVLFLTGSWGVRRQLLRLFSFLQLAAHRACVSWALCLSSMFGRAESR